MVAERPDAYPQTSKMYLTPLKPGLDTHVLTDEFVYHPLSFAYLYKKEPFKKLLLPVMMPLSVVRKQPYTIKNELFTDYQVQPNKELKMINKDVIKSQEGIFGEVVKRALGSLFSGQGLVGMSMPIKIFEPRSTMQRIADNMVYVTSILREANAAKDPAERAKLCLSALVSGVCYSPSNMKPFNPYLGETMEAEYPDGSRIYFEHTSHHPPISNFLIVTAFGARCHGRFEQVADMSTNKMEIIYRGPYNMEFADGHQITMFLPTAKTKGIMWGDRMLKFGKKICYYDPTNAIKGYLEFGTELSEGRFKGNRVDTLMGEVYQFEPKSHKGFGTNYKDVYDAFKGKDKRNTICKGLGSIFENLEFDGKEYWSFDTFVPQRCIPIENPLPSDYRFREDLIWLEYKDQNMAQLWKYKLEEIQRYDRALRQESEKIRKKNKK